MTDKTFQEKINYIQVTLNAPKGQYNSFGKYKYRSTEDILGALKPLLKETGLILNIQDEMVQIGERYYIKATVSLSQGTDGVSSIAYAREAEFKKGMDDSQVTGTASSYARKYALNGLLAIDDTKDVDSMDNRDSNQKKSNAGTFKGNNTTQKSNSAVDLNIQDTAYSKKLTAELRKQFKDENLLKKVCITILKGLKYSKWDEIKEADSAKINAIVKKINQQLKATDTAEEDETSINASGMFEE